MLLPIGRLVIINNNNYLFATLMCLLLVLHVARADSYTPCGCVLLDKICELYNCCLIFLTCIV